MSNLPHSSHAVVDSAPSPSRPSAIVLKRSDEPVRLSIHRAARYLSWAAVILLGAGALVTTTGSGLAVPDWPLSFGTFFPRMVGGVRFEHSHRLIAGAIATATFIIGVWVVRRESRAPVRWLAIAAMLSVFLQALLGGLTVLMKLPTIVSSAHATLGQTYFCMLVALAMVTAPAYRSALRRPAGPHDGVLKGMALATIALCYVQLMIGAWMRHSYGGLAIPTFPLCYGHLLPPTWNEPVISNFAHRIGALAVLLMVGAWVHVILRGYRDEPQLRTAARHLSLALMAQILLGASTIWTERSIIITSLHVVNGALVLATAVVLALWIWRLLPCGAAEAPTLLTDRAVRG
jgi:cytochrome c oxidase assembly protein subunit 15